MSADATEPVIETEIEDAPVAQPTLAEHHEQFPRPESRNAPPKATEDAPVERKGHRAQSQKAGAEDAKAIAAMTRRLREAEEAVAIEKQPGESDRLFQLRKRAELAERASKHVAAPAVQPVAKVEPAVVARPVTQPSAFTEKEPTLDQFASEADPWTSYQRALGRYDRRKDDFDSKQETNKLGLKAQEDQFNREMDEGVQNHGRRVMAYVEAHPEVKAIIDAESAKPPTEQLQFTTAMRGAIEFHERGPEMVLSLLQQPDLADELFLLTNGRAVGDPRTDPLVASVRRRLLQRVPDVTTGAPATPRPSLVAPRPPTPVRTVPQTPREKVSSAPSGSLREHNQRYPRTH